MIFQMFNKLPGSIQYIFVIYRIHAYSYLLKKSVVYNFKEVIVILGPDKYVSALERVCFRLCISEGSFKSLKIELKES